MSFVDLHDFAVNAVIYPSINIDAVRPCSLQEVFIEIQDNFQSSQNTGGNCHFTGNTGITGLRATPAFTGITWINRCATWARLLLSHNDEDWKTCIEGGGAMK